MKYISYILLLFLLPNCFSQNIKAIKINDTRTYEVTATILPNNTIISVWMEARSKREASPQINNTRIGYKISKDNGKTWSNKKNIDNPKREILGNPYLITGRKGRTFLIFMNVNANIFSGNLAFYEWDREEEKFQFKSVPISTNKTLLDKPVLAIKNGIIYLVYNEISQKLANAQIKYQYSSDFGKTWSIPKPITDDKIIYLGASLKGTTNSLVFTTGTYWQQKVYFAKPTIKNQGKLSFPKLQVIDKISDNLQSAMTTLAVDNKGHIAVGWLFNHKPKEICVSVSSNNGENWSKPLLLTNSGNLLSLTFNDSNHLLCLYSDFENKKYSVVCKKIPIELINKANIKKIYIKTPTRIRGEIDYIGAYQKIIHTNNNILAFWIDYSNENKLYFSKWDIE